MNKIIKREQFSPVTYLWSWRRVILLKRSSRAILSLFGTVKMEKGFPSRWRILTGNEGLLRWLSRRLGKRPPAHGA